jgi:hypothetical protein
MIWFLFVVGSIVFLGLCRALLQWLNDTFAPTAPAPTGPTAQRPAGTPTSRPE